MIINAAMVDGLSEESAIIIALARKKPGAIIDKLIFASGLKLVTFIEALYFLDEKNLVSIDYRGLDVDFFKFKVYPKVPVPNC